MASKHGAPKGRPDRIMPQMNAPLAEVSQQRGSDDGARAPGGPSEAGPVRQSGRAAFGSAGGAFVFRDYASI